MIIFQQWERLNGKLVHFLLHVLQADTYEENKMQRIRYSLMVLCSEFEKLLVLGIVFGLLHLLPEFLTAFLAIVPIRAFMGGSHRTTMLGCFLQSLVIFGIILTLSSHFYMGKELQIIIVALLITEIWISTPMISKNRIQYNREQRMRFKSKALTTLLALVMLKSSIPSSYSNIVVWALAVQAMENGILCVQNKRKEENLHEERIKKEIK